MNDDNDEIIISYNQVINAETAQKFISRATGAGGFTVDALHGHARYWWTSDFANLIRVWGEEDAMRNKIGASWVILTMSGDVS